MTETYRSKLQFSDSHTTPKLIKWAKGAIKLAEEEVEELQSEITILQEQIKGLQRFLENEPDWSYYSLL